MTALQQYRRHMELRGLRQGSIDKRMRILARCQDALGRPLLTATTAELRDWLERLRLTTRTRYSYISHLGCFWRWAVVEELATADPTLRIARPRVRPGVPRPIATVDLRFAIDNAPDAAMRAMLHCAAYAGMRCCEIAALEAIDVMGHLDPPAVLLHGKGGKDRVVPMHPDLADALRALPLPARGLVFRRVDGRPMEPWKVSAVLRRHLHDCGITASAHRLRHWFGTHTYRESAGDLRLTQELMGHSSPTTTAGYTAWAQERAAEVIARLAA